MLEVLPRSEATVQEPDRFGDAPHPREVLSLIGHDEAEAEVLAAIALGRLHHAWLITGEEGIGKATFAYRIARALLAGAEHTTNPLQQGLAVPARSPAAHQIAAHAHPDLAVIRRGLSDDRKRVLTEISVKAALEGLELFQKTAAYGGYRICIVDACDELNANSANALLKTLEEPPERSLFLLVAHQPGRLLPTIRSRCRHLPLRPLTVDEVEQVTRGLPHVADVEPPVHRRAAELSGGSVRRALSMLDPKKLAFNDRVEALLNGLPRLQMADVDAIAEATMGRAGDESFDRFCDLCVDWLSRELKRRPPRVTADMPLAEAWTALSDGRIEVEALNLDRRPFVIATVAALAGTFGR